MSTRELLQQVICQFGINSAVVEEFLKINTEMLSYSKKIKEISDEIERKKKQIEVKHINAINQFKKSLLDGVEVQVKIFAEKHNKEGNDEFAQETAQLMDEKARLQEVVDVLSSAAWSKMLCGLSDNSSCVKEDK